MTEEGRDKCTTIRCRMFQALERLLCRRVSKADAHAVISEVHRFIEMFQDKRNKFNEQWDDMFKKNLHILWPSFVWDLLAVPLSEEEKRNVELNRSLISETESEVDRDGQ